MQRLYAIGLACFVASFSLVAEGAPTTASPYAPWSRGPSTNADFFPLAVWLQSPANAERFKAAGINTYIGLWKGPTEEQLSALNKAGMRVLCDQNEVALRHLDDSGIIGWIHGDEPDNAQSLGARLGWGAPIKPEKVVQNYRGLKAADPSRPVLLNLGQGVAWDGWYGRGVRNNHPEDYPKYIEGSDIVSFDIYPAVHDRAEVAGKLWYVAHGVERLVQWSGGKKVVWNCLECTRISNVNRKPTPHEVRAEAWMSLIHGSRGLIYFVHQFKPVFREAALLDDPEMLAAVTKLNRQINDLAPVLNSVETVEPVSARSSNSEVPVATMTKAHGEWLYVFAVAMRAGSTEATFNFKAPAGQGRVEVLWEDRTLPVSGTLFTDKFGPWDVHAYRVQK